ncbi:amino acid ABC transporter permease [Egicoccus sp. AB-alg2]|uniref:amino acid ABC transporter permease n=1 Tax=Egicoccus sp. AB-alg2 TaxID=3242693 RepID=UPI00359E3D48
MSGVIAEELGPRGRKRVRLATIVAVVLIAAFFAWLVMRLAAEGQFEGRLWEPFIDPASVGFLLEGVVGTLRAALVAMVIAASLGLVLALGRLSPIAPLRWISGLIVDVFRGPPVLLWIFFSFFALPQVLPGQLGVTVGRNPLYALVIGLSAYNMAVLAEIYRAGILSLDRGQREAALAVGMPRGMAMRLVILPQALRRMIPAILAQLATLTKDTALGYIIAVPADLAGRGRRLAQFAPINDLQTWFVVGVLYFVVIWGLMRLARNLETRQRRSLGAGGMQVRGEADLAALDEDAAEVKA